jgi:hypothetical protein
MSWFSAIWSGRQDSNLRPLAPHASALPGCATPRGRSFTVSVVTPFPGRQAPAGSPQGSFVHVDPGLKSIAIADTSR